jgi:PIN domain nuclease of toxin-antitoxin system
MKYLIDTHTFLWFNEGAPELSPKAKMLIQAKNNEIFISIASLWEISIKIVIGKLDIIDNYELLLNDLAADDIKIMSVNFQHTVMQKNLPLYHRDPFDRMIISQSIVENMDVIGRDDIFDKYFEGRQVKRIW